MRNNIPVGQAAPDDGQPGNDGVTIRIGNMLFEGGQGGSASGPSKVARGGQKTFPGGNGGLADIADSAPGTDVGTQKGGQQGPRPTDGRGFGGIPGGGGGASRVGRGGRGGSAGSGNGSSQGAMNNAGEGGIGLIGAGGGGGGGAAGGTFPGGNGGRGGDGWIIIYAFRGLPPETSPSEPFPGNLTQ